MTIYEDDIYNAEHDALQRIENIVWRMELDEKQLYRVAGYIAGIRAMGNRLLDMVAEDKKDTLESILLERRERDEIESRLLERRNGTERDESDG